MSQRLDDVRDANRSWPKRPALGSELSPKACLREAKVNPIRLHEIDQSFETDQSFDELESRQSCSS
jgi:hypothetical protein